MITGCKTIAEFQIKRWMEENRFEMGEFSVEVNGYMGVITDKLGDTMRVCYDSRTKTVQVMEGKAE